MKNKEKSANSQFSAGVSFQANGDARFVSQNVRDIGSQFQAKMSRMANSPASSREGFAFEYLDAIDQQINLGGRYKVDVPDINGKNSPDILIKSRSSGNVVKEQQLKLNSRTADNAANSGSYGKQEIRTPKEQARNPTNSKVKESNVSTSEVSKGAKNPHQANSNYQFKAAMAEIANAAAIGAITGAVAATLMSSLAHFLAVERGEMEIDDAIAAVFLNTIEGAVIGSASGGLFAAIPAFIPALIPVLNIISVPLLTVGAFQLVNQVGEIIDRHTFAKRNARLEEVHRQDAAFFESFDQQVMAYLQS
ncbi:hypothetical protein NIES2119_28490 [[Phormidium ambiguum] IAM M-71]|uniref:Uncharacterized protein n=1 Tax=[Phormidium ambiguum] IAM M-71 TaxID=454136 RepID=A0A1U7I5P2_9CYAN|nr:hypothetical protein [Phormidium ambiguum]OKH31547.1 hypothetical protein NIES2119_28490 [Phormidium ambiguum IAM M-71]